MKTTIIYLVGHYGVGKLTVAKEICALTGARLLDNHLINNVVFSLVRVDGHTPVPGTVWEHIGRIREIAFEAIETVAPPEFSYVLTNALTEEPDDRQWFNRTIDLARRRGAVFLPVELHCDEAENVRRIDTPDRAANMKFTNPEASLARRRAVTPLRIDHPNLLSLDSTHLPPAETARQIIAHAERLTT
jgi:hypothetical protein